MYYEEDVINGVLCWRGSPDGEWTPYTARELTEALVRSRAEADRLRADLEAMGRLECAP